MYSLNDELVRLNAATFLLNLVGTILGLDYQTKSHSKIMFSFEFLKDRQFVPIFTQGEIDKLQYGKEHLPERELRGGSWLENFIFHVLMAFRHPKQLLRPIIRNKAILLPLSLPRLVIAAVSPSFILLFTTENRNYRFIKQKSCF